jgi:hypothetical protein
MTATAAAREGLGDGVPADAADGGDGGVSEHVRGDRGSTGPGQDGSGSGEETVVIATGDRSTVAASEQRPIP